LRGNSGGYFWIAMANLERLEDSCNIITNHERRCLSDQDICCLLRRTYIVLQRDQREVLAYSTRKREYLRKSSHPAFVLEA